MVDHVVAAAGRGLQVDRTDRDHAGLVPWRADGAVGFLAAGVEPEVAAGHHHHDALGHRAAHRTGQRVGLIRLGRVGTQAQVHHPDVLVPAVVDDPVDAGQHVGQLAVAVVVEHADVEQVGVGRDAGGVFRLVGAAAGRHGSDVRAMAIAVGLGGEAVLHTAQIGLHRRAGGVQRARHVDARGPVAHAGAHGVTHLGEIDRFAHPAVAAIALEVGVLPGDARIEHGNADAPAGDAGDACPIGGAGGAHR